MEEIIKTTHKLKFDDQVTLNANIWIPATQDPLGVVVIAHGMAEHIGRYQQLAHRLVTNGYLVIGADLYGHGLSVNPQYQIGQIKDYDFMDAIIKSIKLLTIEVASLSSNRILFAHSMSSFVALRYLELYPNDFTKVILSGTDCYNFKYRLASLILKPFKGPNRDFNYSPISNKFGVARFNKSFTKDHPHYGWLSTNLDEVKKYQDDPLCGTPFPSNYYYSLSTMLANAMRRTELRKINPDLKIMMISGDHDPVGDFSKGPTRLAKKLQHYHFQPIVNIYPGRHELLHETPETVEMVLNDIIDFIK